VNLVVTIDGTTISGKNTIVDKPLSGTLVGGFVVSGMFRVKQKLRALGPRLRSTDTRTVRPPPPQLTDKQRFKKADPFYASPEFRAWRAKIVARAGGRCEAHEYGHRCTKAQPAHRMFADHVHEIRDGGEQFNPSNGQCLGGPHHLMKTAQVRRERVKTFDDQNL